jgi:WD40 repeat protein
MPDGKKTVGLEGGQIIVRRADSGTVLGKVGRAIGVFTLVDSKRVVAVGHGMDTTSMRMFKLDGTVVWSKTLQYMGGIRQVRLSANRRHLVAVNDWGTLLFDLNTQKLRAKIGHAGFLPQSSCGGLDFFPDSRWFVYAERKKLHAESAQCTRTIDHQGKNIQEIVLTPDGQRLLVVDKGSAVSAWDTTSWELVGQYDWEVGPLVSIAVSPDGCRAAVGSTSGNLLLWDLHG